MNSYPAYRPSGVEWLGELPDHWSVQRLGIALRDTVGGGTPDTAREEYWAPPGEDGLPWLAIADMSGGGVVLTTEKWVTSLGLGAARLRPLPVGTVVHSMYASVGAVARLGVRAVTNQAILGLLTGPELDASYLYWWLEAIRGPVLALTRANTQSNLNAETVRKLPTALPPLDEQRAIAAYLDRETERIDALVAKKRQLVERLQEYRTALITRTVTRGFPPDAAHVAGLDPSPRLKPSGVEWLGDVPEHWAVRPLHALTQAHRPIIYGIVLPGPHVDEGVPIVKGGDVRERVPAGAVSSNTTFELDRSHARSRLVVGDLVFAIRGSVGDVAEVPRALHGANITQDAARISPLEEVNSTWLKHFLASDLAKDQVRANALGATISGINIRDLRRVLVPTPPRPEQDRIAAHLASASARLDDLRERVVIAIERLQEYRTALITASVTGKIDVRESATTSGGPAG